MSTGLVTTMSMELGAYWRTLDMMVVSIFMLASRRSSVHYGFVALSLRCNREAVYLCIQIHRRRHLLHVKRFPLDRFKHLIPLPSGDIKEPDVCEPLYGKQAGHMLPDVSCSHHESGAQGRRVLWKIPVRSFPLPLSRRICLPLLCS